MVFLTVSGVILSKSRISASGLCCYKRIVCCFHLDLDLPVGACCFCPRYCFFDRYENKVVVLDENTVAQARPVGIASPERNCFFIETRRPGQVLRVPATRQRGFSPSSPDPEFSVCVAIPLILPIMLSAVRSTSRIFFASPESEIRTSPVPRARRRGCPAVHQPRNRKKGPPPSERPAAMPSCSARITARQVISGMIASEVISPNGASSSMNFFRYSSGTMADPLNAITSR